MNEHNEFNTKIEKNNYTITFNTNNQQKYEFVEKACRAMVERNDITVFIELPCAVDDIVYIIEDKEIKAKKVKAIHIYNGDVEVELLSLIPYVLYLEDYDKEWFTDKALAEAKLKELNHEL